MTNIMTNLIIVFLLILVFFVGVILLQIYLSKKENKWSGLILPIVVLFFSIILILGLGAYTFVRTPENMMANGEIIEMAVSGGNVSSAILMVITTFLLLNIPTVILLAIYAANKDTRNRRRALDKMSALDLE